MTEAGQNRIQSFAFCLAVFAAVCLCICFVLSSPGESRQWSGIELDSRINPNDASMGSLVRLPGIGISRAGAIVAYREILAEKAGGGAAFRNCDDLQKVKGIGPKTVQNIGQWLKFE